MSCDQVQQRLSEAFDGVAATDDVDITAHLRDCAGCRAFTETMEAVRQRLRVVPLDQAPDLAPAVIARLEAPAPLSSGPRQSRWRDRRWIGGAAAAFVAGALVGASLVGEGPASPPRPAAAELPGQVVAAQRTLESLTATVEVIERGWHPSVPERRLQGTLRYRAPESFALQLRDRTEYPDRSWQPNDLTLVVDDDRMWSGGLRDCPAAAQPGCTPAAPRVRAVVDREPFADSLPVPLDLVLPVDGFRDAAAPAALGQREVDGRSATGVTVTAAQIQGVLAPLRTAGNLREIHPSDRVDLWLDTDTLTPLLTLVRPAPGVDRARWAARRGYADADGPVLEIRLGDLTVNGDVDAGAFPPPPVDGVSAGFRDGPAPAVPTPARLPAGMAPFRSGVVQVAGGSPVAVRTWTDGRAWVAVRAVAATGGEPPLFDDLGPLVRPQRLGAAGLGYVGDGRRIALHGADLDLVVSGSLSRHELTDVASSLGVTGEIVPAEWGAASTATLAEAAAARPGLLQPRDLEGFEPPAVRIDDDVVVLSYAGPGDRAFLLVQGPGRVLTPAADPDARGVRVGDVVARYLPETGELSWVARDTIVSLRSTTLAVGELAGIARRLEPRP